MLALMPTPRQTQALDAIRAAGRALTAAEIAELVGAGTKCMQGVISSMYRVGLVIEGPGRLNPAREIVELTWTIPVVDRVYALLAEQGMLFRIQDEETV